MRLPSDAFSSLKTTLQRCQLHKPAEFIPASNLLTPEAKRLLRLHLPSHFLAFLNSIPNGGRVHVEAFLGLWLRPNNGRRQKRAMSHPLSRALPRGWPQVSAALRHLFDLCAVDAKCCEEECDRSKPPHSQSEKKRRPLSFQTNTSIIHRQKSL